MPMPVKNDGAAGMRFDRRQNVWSIDERQSDSVTQADRRERVLNDLMMQ